MLYTGDDHIPLNISERLLRAIIGPFPPFASIQKNCLCSRALIIFGLCDCTPLHLFQGNKESPLIIVVTDQLRCECSREYDQSSSRKRQKENWRGLPSHFNYRGYGSHIGILATAFHRVTSNSVSGDILHRIWCQRGIKC